MNEEFATEKRNDTRSTAELINLALIEPDEDKAWEPVTVLQFRATRDVLDAAECLCDTTVAKKRELGANILGQLGVPKRAFPEECFQILCRMLPEEKDPGVLDAIAVAFGHLDDPRCIELLVPLKTHPDSEVRFGIVHGLSGHDHPLAIRTLIELSKDIDDDVRNWATFALGTLIQADNHEIRDALLARSTDAQDECRGEALVGMARRKDGRVFEPLLKELATEGVGSLAIEAAAEIADPRLLPLLLELKDDCLAASGSVDDDIERAIAACRFARDASKRGDRMPAIPPHYTAHR